MCVILHKEVGKEIPFDDLKQAALRHKDGWGIVVPDRGQLEVYHGLDQHPEKHAEDVAEFLEQCKGVDAFIHFRYATKGDKTLDNVHPFAALTKKDDGLDVQVMHNGTFWGYDAKDGKSDTAIFTEQVIRPLLLREFAYLQDEEYLLDGEFMRQTLRKYAGDSVVTLISPHGYVTLNRSQGIARPYGWASNTYTFIEPKKPTTKTHTSSNVTVYNPTTPFIPSTSSTANNNKKQPPNPLSWGERIRLAPQTAAGLADCQPSWRVTALELTGVDCLSDFQRLDQDAILDLVQQDPELGAILIMDLLFEQYNGEYTE